MNQKHKLLLPALTLVVLFVFAMSTVTAQPAGGGQPPKDNNCRPFLSQAITTHTLSKYFIPASFPQRRPRTPVVYPTLAGTGAVKKDITRNNILTDSYVRTTPCR
jgi:hypothetical protein